MEIWKDIKGYEGLYQISNMGNVKSLKYHRGKREKILKSVSDYGKGYLRVSLCKNSNYSNNSIHRLVAKAFILNENNLQQINHKNGIKTDNRVENLEWCTCSENIKHAWKTGLRNTNNIKIERLGE